jgi:hypothetical protein
MRRVVFLGPTLGADEARSIAGGGCTILPPARRGDLYSAAKVGPSVIGLVDGYFRSEAAVLHKEILWAIDQGCRVYGAASMGALRGAELHPFSMIGVGEIFEAFASGVLHRDDEVAVEHGPRELGYLQTSEALVNMRFTVAAGVRAGRVPRRLGERLITIAAEIFYPHRNYPYLFEEFTRAQPVGPAERAAFAWILSHRIDQKAEDARSLLRILAVARPPRRATRHRPVLEDTEPFSEFRNRYGNPLTRHLA